MIGGKIPPILSQGSQLSADLSWGTSELQHSNQAVLCRMLLFLVKTLSLVSPVVLVPGVPGLSMSDAA